MSGRRRIARGAAVALIALAVGCGSEEVDPGARGPRARGDAVVGGEVVSTVDGRAITLDTLRHAAGEAGVRPRVALRRLQDEELLAGAAARRGLTEDPAVRRAARQAMVQALLRDLVEAEVGPGAIDDAEVEAAFEQSLARWESPERRASVHVLARLPAGAAPEVEAAARAYVEERLRAAAQAPDPAASLRAVRRRPPDDHAFEVVVEDVPPLSRRDAADPVYLEALFRADGEALWPAPVRSSFGWHAIAVTEVQPATETPRAEALATIRAERLAERRSERLGQLLAELASRRGVALSADHHALLAGPEVPGVGP